MQIEIALRWMRVLWFLSLDLWRPFAKDLWLDTPKFANIQLEMQRLLDPAQEFPSFGSDPRARCYEHLQQIQMIYGSRGLRYLSDWQRLVFVQGGSDRIEQSAWNQLGIEMLSQDFTNVAYHAVLKGWREELVERERIIRENLKLSTNITLSNWDRIALQAEGETADSIFGLVQNISSANAFVKAWEHHCTTKGQVFLNEIFKAGEQYMLSLAEPHFLFSVELLPFPSSWEITRLSNDDVESAD